jgi:hypothetical protein
MLPNNLLISAVQHPVFNHLDPELEQPQADPLDNAVVGNRDWRDTEGRRLRAR